MAKPPTDPVALDARGLRVALIVSRYNGSVTGPMREGAERAFLDAGGDPAHLTTVSAPGAFELAAIAAAALRSGRFDAAVCLGCVLKGETRHDEVIADALAGALAGLSAELARPAAFGVLTVDSHEQAVARASGDRGDKGAEAMNAAIDAVAAIRRLTGETA
jgi:6,7-dimethyl-8-ribityllumazine synthase